MEKISNLELRKYIINAQLSRLLLAEYNDLKQVIAGTDYVQLDTIHVTERAHHHVLWTRYPGYKKEMLDDLMSSRQVFEYWTHAASILPIESFKYTLRRKQNFSWHNHITDTREFKELLIYVYERICNEGALSASDFNDKNPHPNEIWSWKHSRYALEHLFQQGTLMVAGRNKFRKIFDLTERVYPQSEKIECPSTEEAAEFQVTRAISALGAATEKQIINYLRFSDAESIKKMIAQQSADGRVNPVKYHNKVYYTSVNPTVQQEYPEQVFILSPFDNLIINRQRILDIFDFDYKLECYLPAAKRKYGFFSMPLLYQDRFIGLLDAKADRKGKVLLINNLIKFAKLNESEEKLLNSALEDFAAFNNCRTIDFNPSFTEKKPK
ncbi:MAG: crosslink repair DNA glycosylase YcaQ family protein [Candidatus Stygibacter frigidus]|nr:crosslink repair DNA glycosylase YcaQ family protein [Candidatus Stygibacter frigidus]